MTTTRILPLGAFTLLAAVAILAGCAATQTFSTAARAGDTVALAVGWKKTLSRQNLTVTVTGSDGTSVVTYGPNDSHVRSIVNLYPDPVSKAIVGAITNQDLGVKANDPFQGPAAMINTWVTKDPVTQEHDSDWWQTTVLLDLPATTPTGAPWPTGDTTITMSDSGGVNLHPAIVTIVPGVGQNNLFNIYNNWGGSFSLLSGYPQMLPSMERADRYTVTFDNSGTSDASGNKVIPRAIQMQLRHTAGTGKTWIVNPRGDIKTIMWRDDGSVITAALMTTQAGSLTQMLDYKFYIAGGIANPSLVADSFKAYDVNGNPISGITTTIQ